MCLERVPANQQQPLQASKWQQIAVLLAPLEMSELILEVCKTRLFYMGRVCPLNELELSPEHFLATYQSYVETLKTTDSVQDKTYQASFTLACTRTVQALYAIELNDRKAMVRPREPVIQIQLHRLSFSSVDQTIRSMVHGEGALSWGLQFSFPQLYRVPGTQKILTLKEYRHSENAQAFHALQRWVRKQTLPTPFLINGTRVNSPIRIGKDCCSWVHQYVDRQMNGLSIDTTATRNTVKKHENV